MRAERSAEDWIFDDIEELLWWVFWCDNSIVIIKNSPYLLEPLTEVFMAGMIQYLMLVPNNQWVGES